MSASEADVIALLELHYVAARKAVAEAPEFDEWRAMAAEEAAGIRAGYFARNMLAIQVEMRMPPIELFLAALREVRPKRHPWWLRRRANRKSHSTTGATS